MYTKRRKPIRALFLGRRTWAGSWRNDAADVGPAAPPMQAPNAVCQQAAQEEAWAGKITIAFDEAATMTEESGRAIASEVHRTATLTVTFDQRTTNGAAQPVITWRAIGVTGQAALHDTLTTAEAESTRVTTSQGAQTPTNFTGSLRLDTAACTYQLHYGNRLLITESTEGSQRQREANFTFAVVNVPLDVEGQLVGATDAESHRTQPPPDQNHFQYDGSAAATELQRIRHEQEAPTLGVAAIAWDLTAQAAQPVATQALFLPLVVR